MQITTTAPPKKVWVKPEIVEAASLGTAQARKTFRATEGLISIGGFMISVGPAS